MNYQENKEFVKYYTEHILIDLKPIMLELIKDSIIYTGFENEHYKYKYYDRELDIFRYMNPYQKSVNRAGKRYDEKQIEQMFFNHINKVEYKRFCEILRIDYENIFDWYMRSVNSEYRADEYFIKILEDKYRIYFRDERRRLRNIEKKNKNLKIKEI